MDNASYHSVIKEGTKAPTSATRKGDMQKFPSKITLDIPPYHFDRVKFTMVWGEAQNIMTFST
jgi:hypothetical protein